MNRKVEKVKLWRLYDNKEILQIKNKDCVKCAYATRTHGTYGGMDMTCSYIERYKHSRPCQPGQCREVGVWKKRVS